MHKKKKIKKIKLKKIKNRIENDEKLLSKLLKSDKKN